MCNSFVVVCLLIFNPNPYSTYLLLAFHIDLHGVLGLVKFITCSLKLVGWFVISHVWFNPLVLTSWTTNKWSAKRSQELRIIIFEPWTKGLLSLDSFWNVTTVVFSFGTNVLKHGNSRNPLLATRCLEHYHNRNQPRIDSFFWRGESKFKALLGGEDKLFSFNPYVHSFCRYIYIIGKAGITALCLTGAKVTNLITKHRLH